jgi:hypothetical protein
MLRRWEGVSGEGRFNLLGVDGDEDLSVDFDASGEFGVLVAFEDDEVVARAYEGVGIAYAFA